MIKKFLFSLVAARAKAIVQAHRPYIIGVTGTVGKTTTTNFIATLLVSQFGKDAYTSPYAYNGEIGLPLTILQSRSPGKNPFLWLWVILKSYWIQNSNNYPKYLVLEYGVDTPGEMTLLTQIAAPDLGVILNIEKNHVLQFPQFEDYIAEKLALPKACKKFIYNADHPVLSEYAAQMDKPKIGVGLTSKAASLQASHVVSGISELSFQVSSEQKQVPFCLKIFGAFQVQNILPAIAVGQELGMSLETIAQVFATTEMEVLKWRGTLLRGVNDTIIIDGSYNGGFTAITTGIAEVCEVRGDKEVFFLLGDMRELGEETKPLHEKLWSLLEQSCASQIVLVGPETLKHIVPILEKSDKIHMHFFDSRQAGKYIRQQLLSKEVNSALVYVKWSQNTIYLEEGVKEMLFDPRDFVKLCRQSDSWAALKEDFFENVLEDKPKQI